MARVRLIHPRTKEERVVDERAVGGFPGFVRADNPKPAPKPNRKPAPAPEPVHEAKPETTEAPAEMKEH